MRTKQAQLKAKKKEMLAQQAMIRAELKEKEAAVCSTIYNTCSISKLSLASMYFCYALFIFNQVGSIVIFKFQSHKKYAELLQVIKIDSEVSALWIQPPIGIELGLNCGPITGTSCNWTTMPIVVMNRGDLGRTTEAIFIWETCTIKDFWKFIFQATIKNRLSAHMRFESAKITLS